MQYMCNRLAQRGTPAFENLRARTAARQISQQQRCRDRVLEADRNSMCKLALCSSSACGILLRKRLAFFEQNMLGMCNGCEAHGLCREVDARLRAHRAARRTQGLSTKVETSRGFQSCHELQVVRRANGRLDTCPPPVPLCRDDRTQRANTGERNSKSMCCHNFLAV